MAQHQGRALGFEEFTGALGSGLALRSAVAITRSTRLQEDLDFDSLDLLRLGFFVETLADVLVLDYSDVDVPENVGQVYDLYRALVDARDEEL